MFGNHLMFYMLYSVVLEQIVNLLCLYNTDFWFFYVIRLRILFLFQLDPELEFDREVYPLGLLPNAGVVVGVSQRMSFSACTEFPCFEPSPQAQTILHCLLRHLLQVTLYQQMVLLFAFGVLLLGGAGE